MRLCSVTYFRNAKMCNITFWMTLVDTLVGTMWIMFWSNFAGFTCFDQKTGESTTLFCMAVLVISSLPQFPERLLIPWQTTFLWRYCHFLVYWLVDVDWGGGLVGGCGSKFSSVIPHKVVCQMEVTYRVWINCGGLFWLLGVLLKNHPSDALLAPRFLLLCLISLPLRGEDPRTLFRNIV